MRVLLTGGTGYLGSAIARALAGRGHEVVVFSRHASGSGVPGTPFDGDVRNVLLTLARVWFTLQTGTIASKDVAADWAITRLPVGRGDAIRLARAGYLGELQDSWDGDALATARADAAAVREAIFRL